MPSVCSDIIEDIEDLGRGDDLLVNTIRQRRDLKLYLRKHKMEEEATLEAIDADSFIPGLSRIYIKTWGCAHNNSDSEYMAGQLAASGYSITEDKFAADLWVLNSCTVKSPAEDHFRNEIKLAKDNNKLLVVAGCVSQSAPKSPYLEGLSIVGVQQIDRVVEVVEETLKGHTVRLLGQKKEKGKKKGGASLQLPKIRKNPLVEIIPINTGCLNQCTYCKTKHARGHLGSYPIEEIVERAKHAFQDGVCEIWLTSEDTGAYGRDLGLTLPDLLYELVKVIPYGCMLRLGMTNPPYIYDYLEDIAQIMSLPSVYAFLHVPVQSGSDKVLADMKREYCISDFERVVDFLRKKVPGITIATDIICGFPTESEEDFEETVKLVEKYKFPSLFINQFYPRPFTPAAKLPRIPTQEVKRRSKKLSEIFSQILPYSHKVGQIQRILVTEISKDRKHFVGHNKFYEQVLVPKRYDVMGRMLDVQILSTGKHFLMGKPVQTGTMFSPSVATPLPPGSLSGFSDKISSEGTSVTKDSTITDNQIQSLDASKFWKMCLIALFVAFLYRYISRWWPFW